MACLPCQQQRQAFVHAARKMDLRGVAQAIGTAAAINVDKLRGVDVAKKYGGSSVTVVKAKPYKRPPDRTG